MGAGFLVVFFGAVPLSVSILHPKPFLLAFIIEQPYLSNSGFILALCCFLLVLDSPRYPTWFNGLIYLISGGTDGFTVSRSVDQDSCNLGNYLLIRTVPALKSCDSVGVHELLLED
jgi:hypothetical protein